MMQNLFNSNKLFEACLAFEISHEWILCDVVFSSGPKLFRLWIPVQKNTHNRPINKIIQNQVSPQ